MAVRIAINGFGRIGRLTLRAIAESGGRGLEVAAVNDLGDAETNGHLLLHDSVHGKMGERVSWGRGFLRVGKRRIASLSERDPTRLPWGEMGVDVVLECTGRFANREGGEAHLKAGAARVLISAPASGSDFTVVRGVNDMNLRKRHKIVSNASCTTNCLAPVVKVLDKYCGIDRGHMTTVHAWTSDQNVHDGLHKDLRRSRAAGLSMIPTSTGAARAVEEVFPHLAGRLAGTAIRVPVPNVSLIDLVISAKKRVDRDGVNKALAGAAAKKPLKGILGAERLPIVSSDVNHNSLSSLCDLGETSVTDGRLVRVLSWYDNEWGFANRMSEMALVLGRL